MKFDTVYTAENELQMNLNGDKLYLITLDNETLLPSFRDKNNRRLCLYCFDEVGKMIKETLDPLNLSIKIFKIKDKKEIEKIVDEYRAVEINVIRKFRNSQGHYIYLPVPEDYAAQVYHAIGLQLNRILSNSNNKNLDSVSIANRITKLESVIAHLPIKDQEVLQRLSIMDIVTNYINFIFNDDMESMESVSRYNAFSENDLRVLQFFDEYVEELYKLDDISFEFILFAIYLGGAYDPQ